MIKWLLVHRLKRLMGWASTIPNSFPPRLQKESIPIHVTERILVLKGVVECMQVMEGNSTTSLAERMFSLHKLTKKKKSGNEFGAVATGLVVGADNKTFVTVSHFPL